MSKGCEGEKYTGGESKAYGKIVEEIQMMIMITVGRHSTRKSSKSPASIHNTAPASIEQTNTD